LEFGTWAFYDIVHIVLDVLDVLEASSSNFGMSKSVSDWISPYLIFGAAGPMNPDWLASFSHFQPQGFSGA
jgi:hypothetical protein